MKRKRIAIVTSFFRLGQWRGIMRYGQTAGWICQRHDRESIGRLEAWNPDGVESRPAWTPGPWKPANAELARGLAFAAWLTG